MTREQLEFDVVIIGGGPAGLAASIRLAQLNKTFDRQLEICVIDKGEEIGAHILSGAVLEPRALNELLPDWKDRAEFMYTPVQKDQFLFLTKNKFITLPTPPTMHNEGNFIISLGQLCKWLAQEAENLGVNIFPGFAATEIIYAEDRVIGVVTGDKGLDRLQQPKPQFQSGMELRAKQILFAEGCRGSLSKMLIKKFNLNSKSDPQTYGLGIKELWEVPAAKHSKGLVTHTIGWPLDNKTYGGSFIYHLDNNLIATGFVIALDYKNPYLNPYEEFQRFKNHACIRPLLENSKRIAYGARTLVEGGIQSIPTLAVPGAMLIGDAAGFLNVAKIKGIHNAMKSGMIAAESIFELLTSDKPSALCSKYPERIKNSWVWQDLWKVRNIRPAFQWGLWPGVIYAAIDTYLFQGSTPWTFHHKIADHDTLNKAKNSQQIIYPKHDNQVSFDLSTSVFLANVKYEENQPYHLRLGDKIKLPIDVNLKQYASPETRYCPAGVYEIVFDTKEHPRLQINGGNCIHCKACDIKDPLQNITWTPSEGGSGPNYGMM